MHTRLLTLRGARDIDAGIALIRDEVVPILRAQDGYRGLTASADRPGSLFATLSLWDTEANRDASFGPLTDVRERATAAMGGELTVENFEEVVAEVATPPTIGAALMATRVSMDPSKIDENVAFFKAEVLPRISATSGFMALRNMIDRTTGRGAVGSVWKDQDALQKAASQARERRSEAVARGVTFEEDSFREIVFADTP